MGKIKIGVIREGKVPPDERVPLTPHQCAAIESGYPGTKVVVQSSDVRRITDQAYRDQGVEVVEDIADCDVLFGVKEVPKDQLIPGKTYFFFSHTIKEQPYNRDLLQTVIDKKIKLVDYECLTHELGGRILGFGRYAGIVGAFNAIRTWGLKNDLFDLKPAHLCKDKKEMMEVLSAVQLPSQKIVLTGGGRVAGGAIEILEAMGIRKVSVEQFLNAQFDHPVYVQLGVLDYNRRKDGQAGEVKEFFEHPDRYHSDFMRFAQKADMYLACHYWDAAAPFIFTREDARADDFHIDVVADISCDIDGPVASTIRPSTIADPIYGYDPQAEQEVDFKRPGAIAVMAVDNLPCELPVDASEDFGGELLKHIIPVLLGDDHTGIIERATIAENGALTADYLYLTDYLNGVVAE